MGTPFEDARRALPNLPEDVCHLWLDELVRAHGWPPEGAAWNDLLFGRSLRFWKELRWTRELLALSPEDLGPKSLEGALRVVNSQVHAARGSPAGDTPEARERFDSICGFIAEHASLPAPLVIVSTMEGYEIAQGMEAIGAMLWVAARRGHSGFFPSRVPAWVGAIRAA